MFVYVVKFVDNGKYLDCVGMEVDRRQAFEFATREEAQEAADYYDDGVCRVCRVRS